MKTERKFFSWKMLAVLSIAIIAAAIAAQVGLGRIADRKWRNLLAQAPPGLELSIGSVNTNLFNGSVVIHDIDIAAHEKGSNESPAHRFHFASMEMTGIPFMKMLFGKNITVEEVKLDHGKIVLNKSLLEKADSSQFDYLYQLKMPVNHIGINHVKIVADELWTAQDTVLQQLAGWGRVDLRGLVITSSARQPDKLQVGFDAVESEMDDIRYPVAGAHCNIAISRLVAESRTGRMILDSVKIIPLYGKFEFGRKMGEQSDRVQASIVRVECTATDFAALRQKRLVARKIFINEPNVNVFRDRRIPRSLKTRPLPGDYLNKIPWTLRVDSLVVARGRFAYEEFPKEGKQSGILRIERFESVIAPCINHPDDHTPTHILMTVSGSIMGSGSVQARISMPLENSPDYLVIGAITDLDLTRLNNSAENLGLIHIESGLLNKLDFHFTMNEEKATGKIVGEYHNLVIDKLKMKGGQNIKVAWFKSAALKTLIIPKNKDKSMDVADRTGKIDYKRDPTRYMSYYLLHSLLTGIKSSFTLGFLLPS